MEQVIQNKLLLIDFRAAELCQSRRHCRGWSLGKSENKVGKSHDDPERERQSSTLFFQEFVFCVCVCMTTSPQPTPPVFKVCHQEDV